MNTEIIKISELIDNPKNTRRHPEKQIKEFIRSIEMFGQVRPIVIDENNMVLIGHGLKKALETMGKEECSVLRKSNLTEAQKKKLLLSDNKIYSLGVDDYDAIEDIDEDIYGTITHNRARGTHLLEPMKAIVKELLDNGKSIPEISKQLGMKPEEIFRLSDFTRDDFLNMLTEGHNKFSTAYIVKDV